MKKMILSKQSYYKVLDSFILKNEFFVEMKDVTEMDVAKIKKYTQEQLFYWHRIAFVKEKFYEEYIKVENTNFKENNSEDVQTFITFDIVRNSFYLYQIIDFADESHCIPSDSKMKLVHKTEISKFEFPPIDFEWQVDVLNLIYNPRK